jgi:hypothetical protein
VGETDSCHIGFSAAIVKFVPKMSNNIQNKHGESKQCDLIGVLTPVGYKIGM